MHSSLSLFSLQKMAKMAVIDAASRAMLESLCTRVISTAPAGTNADMLMQNVVIECRSQVSSNVNLRSLLPDAFLRACKREGVVVCDDDVRELLTLLLDVLLY